MGSDETVCPSFRRDCLCQIHTNPAPASFGNTTTINMTLVGECIAKVDRWWESRHAGTRFRGWDLDWDSDMGGGDKNGLGHLCENYVTNPEVALQPQGPRRGRAVCPQTKRKLISGHGNYQKKAKSAKTKYFLGLTVQKHSRDLSYFVKRSPEDITV